MNAAAVDKVAERTSTAANDCAKNNVRSILIAAIGIPWDEGQDNVQRHVEDVLISHNRADAAVLNRWDPGICLVVQPKRTAHQDPSNAGSGSKASQTVQRKEPANRGKPCLYSAAAYECGYVSFCQAACYGQYRTQVLRIHICGDFDCGVFSQMPPLHTPENCCQHLTLDLVCIQLETSVVFKLVASRYAGQGAACNFCSSLLLLCRAVWCCCQVQQHCSTWWTTLKALLLEGSYFIAGHGLHRCARG